MEDEKLRVELPIPIRSICPGQVIHMIFICSSRLIIDSHHSQLILVCCFLRS